MKKTILLWWIFSCAVILAWCGTQQITTEAQVISGEETAALSGIDLFGDSWTVLSGQTAISGQESSTKTWVLIQQDVPSSSQQIASGQKLSEDVKKLIEERAKKPVDKSKLTEDDIDLMEKVIQKIQQK